jgi:flagellar protein FliO/FliZ
MNMSAQPEWMDYLRVACALLFVIGLIFFTSLIVRRTGLDKRLTGNKGSARLSIAETLYLDPRRRLVIVRCDGHEYVLLLAASGDLLIETREVKNDA